MILLGSRGAARASGPVVPSVDALQPLTVTVVDAVTGAPLEARLNVRDVGGTIYAPADSAACLYHIGNGGYFYTHGTTTLSVPSGSIIVTASRGLQYRVAVDTVSVAGPLTLTIFLPRWIDMSSYACYGGDTHVHVDHGGGVYTITPADAVWMGRAEGLNIVSCLDNEYHFTGAVDPASTSDCLLYFSEENRTGGYGHHSYLNITRLIDPLFGEPGWPLAMDLADSAHAQSGAVVIAAHPYTTGDFMQTDEWPGSGLNRELPVDAWRGVIDCYDIAAYSSAQFMSFGLDLWYRLLNCGFRVSPSAGTDAAMNRNVDSPLGGYQVFADLTGSSFSYANWCARLKRGRSFVTNGPMVTRFTVKNRVAGDTLSLGGNTANVAVSFAVQSPTSLSSVDIVANGEAIRTIAFPAGRTVIDTSITVTLTTGAWVCVRGVGPRAASATVGDSLRVHTGPVYVLLKGRRATSPEAARSWVDWIDETTTMLNANPDWLSGADSARVYGEFAAARAVYDSLVHVGGTGVGDPPVAGPGPHLDALVRDGRVTLTLDADDPSLRARVFDTGGRIIAEMERVPEATGRARFTWTPGSRIAGGVYFLRVTAESFRRTARIVLTR